ncbi:MAG: hypothetical protein ACLFOY_01430 [Desulfatibacillaceae bacterium]
MADRTVEVFSSSRIYQENVQAARDNALAGAFERAVGQVVLDILSLDDVVDVFEQVSSIVFDGAGDHVRNYRVLAEHRSDKILVIAAKVTVGAEALRLRLKRAGLLEKRAPLPGILYLLNEKTADRAEPVPWWAGATSPGIGYPATDALSSAMEAHGYTRVEGASTVQDAVSSPGFEGAPISPEGAAELGRGADAEITVFGEAVTGPSDQAGPEGVRTFTGAVELVAVRSENGDVLARVSAEGQAASDVEAMEQAARNAAEQLAGRLSGAWKDTGRKPARVLLEVRGTRPYSRYIALRNALAGMEGISRVIPAGTTGMQASLELEFSGDIPALADRLATMDLDGISVHVDQVTGSTIQVTLAEANPAGDFVR